MGPPFLARQWRIGHWREDQVFERKESNYECYYRFHTISQTIRKRIEEHFEWGKTVGKIRQTAAPFSVSAAAQISRLGLPFAVRA